MNFSNPTKVTLTTKYLDSIYKELPNKAIINKFLTNNGATTLEIKSERNSIIIEPNVPVIIGKSSYHNTEVNPNTLLGVSEGVDVEDILAYLRLNTPFKKIITTPESYSKVKEAILLAGYDLYNDFFMLFDECERLIQDSGYRKKIALPIDDFFTFKRRAMISATPLPPSDPRFVKNRFKYIQVKPKAKTHYKKSIEVISTNSLTLSLKKYLDTHPSRHYCIFLNSTEVIASIIDYLDIVDESNIYCARESAYKLKINQFPNSFENLTPTLNKYNFFTSRFFSAVDIMLPYKPTVIILTDTTHAFHSMVDPCTETVQIIGRFRNKIKQAVHISTVAKNHIAKSPQEARCYLEGCESAYTEIARLLKSATTQGAKDTLSDALQRVEYAQYINEDGSKNYFLWDNFVNEERIKSYYISKDNLFKAYKPCKQLTVATKEDKFPVIETVLNRLSKMTSQTLVTRKVAEALRDIFTPNSDYPLEDILYIYKELTKMFPKIVEAYNKLGFETMESLNCDFYKIKKAIYEKDVIHEKTNFEFLDRLSLDFEVGSSYPSAIIINVLRKIITDLNLDLKPQIKLLTEFYDISPRTTIERDKQRKDIKGYTILRKKFTDIKQPLLKDILLGY